MRSAEAWTRSTLATILSLLSGLAWAAPSHAASPDVLYALHCMGCHRSDGAGTPGKVPPLKDSMGRFLLVPGGREFLVRVPGTAQSSLTDAQVAAVLNWMLSEFSPGEVPRGFAPYTEHEVSRIRVPLTSVTPVREALLAEIDALAGD